MSPHLIIILMLSSVTLLIVLLFAVRRRMKKATAAQATPTLSPEQISLPLAGVPTSSTAPATALTVTATPDIEPLPDLDLSSLDLSSVSIPQVPGSTTAPLSDVIDMVDRYKFFQGKNMETFAELLKASNLNAIEIMIREKFEAQKKENAEFLAKEVTTKLIGTVI